MATRIMVVDDEPAIGKLLLYQLGGFGYQVCYVQDGLEALRRLPAARPDLVLLDVMMPLISGWDLCRQIRACSSVPIIMLTGKSADEDIVTGLGAGADDYITKPFSIAQLHARIEAVLRRATAGASLHALVRGAPRPDAHLAAAPLLESPRSAPARLPLVEETILVPASDPAAIIEDRPYRIGPRLRGARVERGLTLHQVERATRVRWEFLQALEQENWSYIPRAELRRALKSYATYLDVPLPARRHSTPADPPGQIVPLQFAVALALVMALVVVGLYLL